MVGASLVRASWMAPGLAMPRSGPPWEFRPVHVPVPAVTVALWLAGVLGCAGVAAGLAAIRGGARVRPAPVLACGLLAVAVLTVLPPVGSSDVLDYAAYGRIAEIGRSPYLTAPYQLRLLRPEYGRAVPAEWERQVSLYGPLATAEQYAAARLGGGSAARVVFWLKLFGAIGFAAVAVAADRVLRRDPAARLRAHLLWTINPLLLWDLVAAGHIDALAAAAGLAGLLLVRAGPVPGVASGGPGPAGIGPAGAGPGGAGPRGGAGLAGAGPGGGISLLRAAAAGLLAGAAADIKIFYLLFALGLAWSLRRQPRALGAAAAGAATLLTASYAWCGLPAVDALIARRDKTTGDSFYRLFTGPTGFLADHVAMVAVAAAVLLGLLALARLPDGYPGLPGTGPGPDAVRPALALSAGWLFVWSYQLPWYDAMVVSLVVVYPASRLDWLVLARLGAATTALLPGNPWLPPGHLLGVLAHLSQVAVAPAVLLAAPAALAVLLAAGRLGSPGRPPDPMVPDPMIRVAFP